MSLREQVLYELRWCPQNMQSLAARLEPDHCLSQVDRMVATLLDEDLVVVERDFGSGPLFTLTQAGNIEAFKSEPKPDDECEDDGGAAVIVYSVLSIVCFILGVVACILFQRWS